MCFSSLRQTGSVSLLISLWVSFLSSTSITASYRKKKKKHLSLRTKKKLFLFSLTRSVPHLDSALIMNQLEALMYYVITLFCPLLFIYLFLASSSSLVQLDWAEKCLHRNKDKIIYSIYFLFLNNFHSRKKIQIIKTNYIL